MKLCRGWQKETTSLDSQEDSFHPKPSPLSTNYCRDASLPNDRDVWVEASYLSSTTGGRIPYYRSLRTGQCRKVEPPTGAHRCVRLVDQDARSQKLIRAVSRQVLSKDQIRSIPSPRPNAKLVQGVVGGPKQNRRRHCQSSKRQTPER